MLRDGGGKIAFFELEDLTGRVNVKVRGKEIDTYAHVLTSGEPLFVTGKVSFPRRDEDAPEDEPEGPREATILLNEARLLVEAVRADTKQMSIRVRADRHRTQHLRELERILAGARGACPVTLHVTMTDGAEAVLSLGREYRVEVGDPLLAGIEKVFGEQVAELR